MQQRTCQSLKQSWHHHPILTTVPRQVYPAGTPYLCSCSWRGPRMPLPFSASCCIFAILFRPAWIKAWTCPGCQANERGTLSSFCGKKSTPRPPHSQQIRTDVKHGSTEDCTECASTGNNLMQQDRIHLVMASVLYASAQSKTTVCSKLQLEPRALLKPRASQVVTAIIAIVTSGTHLHRHSVTTCVRGEKSSSAPESRPWNMPRRPDTNAADEK